MFLGLRMGVTSGGPELYNTTALFQQTGSIGFDFLPADWTTLYQDVNGVTPVTAAGQSVRRMTDRSGLGNHATQATAANAPVSCIFPSSGVRNRANGSAAPSGPDWNAGQTSNGITLTRVASGVDTDGLPYADFTVVGTCVTANSFIECFVSTSSSRVAAATGQSYTTSFIGQIIAGTPPVSGDGFRATSVGETAPSTYVGQTSSTPSQSTSPVTITATYAVSGAVNQVRGSADVRTSLGNTVNYTVRIKALQFELGSSRTNYQFNYSQYNVTEAPFASVRGIMFNGSTQFMQTPSINFQSFTWDGAAQRNFALGCAQPANEAFWPASVVSNGVTVTKVGSGFDANGRPYVDVRYQGTSTANFVDNTYISAQSRTAATVGQQWTCSAIVRVISGTPPASTGIDVRSVEETSPSTFVAQAVSAQAFSTSEVTISATQTIASGNQVRGAVVLSLPTSTTVDLTIRITALQLEQGSTRTAWQGLGTDKVTLVAGQRKLSDAAQASLVGLTTAPDANNGTFVIRAPAAALNNYSFRMRGTVTIPVPTAGGVAPDSAVVSALGDISGDSAIIRRNGVSASISTDGGTGNLSNAAVYIGAEGVGSLFFNGVLTSLVGISRILSTSELAGTEGAANRYLLAY